MGEYLLHLRLALVLFEQSIVNELRKAFVMERFGPQVQRVSVVDGGDLFLQRGEVVLVDLPLGLEGFGELLQEFLGVVFELLQNQLVGEFLDILVLGG